MWQKLNKQKAKAILGLVILITVFTGVLIANRVQNLKDQSYIPESNSAKTINNNKIEMEKLTKETFLKKVFNYEQNTEWKYEGNLPCLIDFYADWCGPCKMVHPILVELSKEYDGKIVIYQIDTEVEQELAAAFGIRSIPSLLFCPVEGQPQMAQGALPKASLKKAIEDILLKEAKQVTN